MRNLFAQIITGYENYMMRLAHQRTLDVLARQSDATLRDIGISRDMLRKGAVSIPLKPTRQSRSERPAKVTSSTRQMAMSRLRAIAELRSYSDRELRDLGITRGSIVEAVANGRPGIDSTATPSATAAAPMGTTAYPPMAAKEEPSHKRPVTPIARSLGNLAQSVTPVLNAKEPKEAELSAEAPSAAEQAPEQIAESKETATVIAETDETQQAA